MAALVVTHKPNSRLRIKVKNMTNKTKRETVVIIFDRNGKFYKYGFDVDQCLEISQVIKGSIKVVSDE